MLVEFTVGNYRSFAAPQTFSLEAAKIKAGPGLESIDFDNVFEGPAEVRLLKGAAIYGNNASGKSNLIGAISTMREMVLESAKDTQAGEPIGVEPFGLSTELEDEPSFFEVVFVSEGQQYRYGFETTLQRIEREWLFQMGSVRESRLFARTHDDINTSSSRFPRSSGLKQRTRPNALFLSVAAQWNAPVAVQLLHWFRHCNVISGLDDSTYGAATLDMMGEPAACDLIVRFVRQLDLSIRNVKVERISVSDELLPPHLPEALRQSMLEGGTLSRVHTLHYKYDGQGHRAGEVWFDLEAQESEGTRKLFLLAGALLDTLLSGGPLLIDEFDARLHPLQCCAIMRLFNSRSTNPYGAQLIFATHDTNLLDRRILRRDQIWFAEKDESERTRLYSLVEFKLPDGTKVRNDASWESDYVRGRYGAIPFLGDPAHVVGEALEKLRTDGETGSGTTNHSLVLHRKKSRHVASNSNGASS